MRIKKINVVASVIIFMAALMPALVYAEHSCGVPEKRAASAEKMEAKRKEIYKELNLTKEQKELLEQNKNGRREQMKTLMNEIKNKRSMIRQELQKDQLNMDSINQINSELKNLQAQILDRRLEGILEVRKVLTPEQFKKFTDRTEERKVHRDAE